MKIIFMGTPDFAVGTLEAIIKAGHEVVLAVTQPDKPKGRGRELVMPPVKECALKHGIPVFQPVKLRAEEAIDELRKYDAEMIVVAAFGQILSKTVLDMTEFGCINVHASLLPKYRGAAPIQWSIINGDEETGVTIMKMNEGIDTGDIITQQRVVIDPSETGGSLFDKLKGIGASLCVETIADIENGTAVYTPQPNAEFSYAKMLTKELGHIDWKKPSDETERLIRALNPWPSAYTTLEGKNLKIWGADSYGESKRGIEPGTVVEVTRDSIITACGSGTLSIDELQLEGKRRMKVREFLPGYHIVPGIKFI